MRADREAAPSLVIHQGLHHQLNHLPRIAIVVRILNKFLFNYVRVSD